MRQQKRFEGFMSASQAKQMRQVENNANRERQRVSALNENEKVRQVYRIGRSLLLEHAMDISKPVLVPRYIGRARLQAGWILSESSSAAIEQGYTDQDGERRVMVLTEEGVIGPANFVDRGIQALRMCDDRNEHFEECDFQISNDYQGHKIRMGLKQNFEKLLHQAGVQIDLNVQ